MQKVSFLALALAVCFTATTQAQPPSFIDLGIIGVDGGTFVFDTAGSGFDTELGLWDSAGIVLDADDDGGPGLESEITATLAAGEYFLGVSEFNSFFEDGFINSGTAFEAGDLETAILNIDGALGGTIEIGEVAGFDETGFFRIEVSAVPEPTSALILLGTAGIALVRRRR